MKKKLDELTYIGGVNIRTVVFKFNLMIVGIYTIFGVVEAMLTGDALVGESHILIGIMPFALLGLIYPTSIYTLSYFQKVKYYMIPVKDVYFYNLKEFYNLKNIGTFLATIAVFDYGMHLAIGTDISHYFVEVLGGFVVSHLFVAIGFFVTTVYTKGYRVMRLGIYLLSFILIVPVIDFALVSTQYHTVIIVLTIVGLVGVLLISLLMNLMDRKMEV